MINLIKNKLNTTFLGYTPTNSNVIGCFEDYFDKIYNDDGQVYLLSKKTYTSEADEEFPEFKYKYGIKCIDMRSFGTEEASFQVSLHMVVLPEYICESKANDIKEMCGTEEISEFDLMGEDHSWNVCLGTETVSYEVESLPDPWYDFYYNPLDNTELKGLLNVAATVLDVIDSMRGFFLDDSWNMIGTNGWDSLREILLGEDMIKLSIHKLRKKIASA